MPTPKRARSTAPRANDKQTPGSGQPKPISRADLQEQIRQRAYELYLERGGQEGHAEEDWLRAEAEISSPGQRRPAAKLA